MTWTAGGRVRSPPRTILRPSCASCARWCRGPPDGRGPEHADPQPGQNNDLIDLTGKQPRLAELTGVGLPARHQDPQPGPAGVRVRAQLHARPRVLDLQLRPAGGQLRRQRALRARPADVPALHVHRPAPLTANQPPRSWTASTPATSPAARAASCSPPPTAPTRSPRAPATRPRPRPAHEAADLHRRCSSRSLPWLVIGVVDAAGEEDRDDAYFVRAIFDNASSLVPGEDVKIAGAAGGRRGPLEVTEDKKAAVTLRIDDEDFTPWKADAELHDPPPVADRREVRGVRARHDAPPRRSRRSTRATARANAPAGRSAPARRSTSTC